MALPAWHAYAPAMDAYRILQVHPEAAQPVIRAAYRALAELYHPDVSRDASAGQRMSELNRAYALVRTPEDRARYDRAEQERRAALAAEQRKQAAPIPTGPGRDAGTAVWSMTPPARRTQASAGPELDFGRYVGWSLGDILRHDPSYLEWLRRHSGGVRYRREIDQLLARPRAAAR